MVEKRQKMPNAAVKSGESHPPNGTERQSKPLTKEQLVEHIRSGSRAREDWRLGVEHEKFGFMLKDRERMSYEHVRHLLKTLQRRFGGEAQYEDDNIIALKRGGQSITLEPGGQFELSGAEVENIHQVGEELINHLWQMKTIAEEIGVGFLGVGFDPVSHLEEVPQMPKDRYRIMQDYMPKVGTKGLHCMYRTCTAQVNLDYESEQDMVEKLRISLSLQPLAVALFANSPFVEGKPNGIATNRAILWTDTAEERCGNLPFVFEPGFGIERYVEWAMDVPMYFVKRDGKFIATHGQSWHDFMQGKLPALPGEYATIQDWANHLGSVWPEVRLKQFLEMRGADCGSWRMICALAAFWVGLLYDKQAQAEALELVSDWTQEERHHLRQTAPKEALRTKFRDATLQDMGAKVLKIAQGGLERRGKEEECYLKPLHHIVATGKTQADVAVELYHTKWGNSVDGMFEEWIY